MNKKIRLPCYIFTAAVMALGLLFGCKSMTPAEATQVAGDETRELVSKYITDEARAKQILVLVDNLEVDLRAYSQLRVAHNEALVKSNADYETSREDLQKLYDAYNKDTRALTMKIAQMHVDMQKLATREEWADIGKQKHRIGGL